MADSKGVVEAPHTLLLPPSGENLTTYRNLGPNGPPAFESKQREKGANTSPFYKEEPPYKINNRKDTEQLAEQLSSSHYALGNGRFWHIAP